MELLDFIRSALVRASTSIESINPDDTDLEHFVLRPSGDGVRAEHIDLRKYRTQPPRIAQDMEVRDVDSFVDYYNRFNSPSALVFARESRDIKAAMVRVIFDYHSAGKPRWCDHSCTLGLKPSREWSTWQGGDGQLLEQAQFAEFIEDNIEDILGNNDGSLPDAATMLEVAQSLEATRSVKFWRRERLASGELAFNYQEEETSGRAGLAGKFSIPERFRIVLPVFAGNDQKVELIARFRYRIRENELRLGYKLNRPWLVEQEEFRGIVEVIQARIDSPILMQ